ncbi:TAXI family TRAP transporter solute-binding subunit [bacterium]|nr:MAG: TAXI family TRAP transporter solute-binding subunit [bacterium]
MKKACVLAIIFSVTLFSANVFAEVYRIKWGAASTRIAMFTYVASVSQHVNKDLKGDVSVVPVETGGLLDNLARVSKGLNQIGLTDNLLAYATYKGEYEYKGKQDTTLRSLWGGYVGPIMNIALAGRGIESMRDLHGRKVGFAPGTAGGRIIKMFWETLGIVPKYQLMGIGATIDGMKQGSIEAYYRIGPLDASVLEIEAVQKLKFLGTTKEELAVFEKKYPYHAIPYVLPAKTYRDQPQDVLFAAYVCGDYTTNRVPEDVIYKIVKTVHAHRKEIANTVQVTKLGGWEDMFGQTVKYVNVPLHKGALKAYTELGYKVPEKLIPPEAK